MIMRSFSWRWMCWRTKPILCIYKITGRRLLIWLVYYHQFLSQITQLTSLSPLSTSAQKSIPLVVQNHLIVCAPPQISKWCFSHAVDYCGHGETGSSSLLSKASRSALSRYAHPPSCCGFICQCNWPLLFLWTLLLFSLDCPVGSVMHSCSWAASSLASRCPGKYGSVSVSEFTELRIHVLLFVQNM